MGNYGWQIKTVNDIAASAKNLWFRKKKTNIPCDYKCAYAKKEISSQILPN